MGSDGSNPRRLTNDSANDVAPVWSPDGRRIAFMSSRDGNWEIYSMGSDGSNPRRLTSNSATDGIPSWSPDSRQIAFESSRDGNFEVYAMGSDGNNPRRLTNNSAVDGFPVWSPDGRHIAFHSSRDDNFEIYVMGSDGSDLSRLTNDPGNDYAPVWSPDGRNITFESSRDGNLEIYSMELRRVDGGSGDVLFFDDFSSGNLSKWTPQVHRFGGSIASNCQSVSWSCNLEVENGALKLVGTEGGNYVVSVSKEIFPTETYSNYVLSFDWNSPIRETPHGLQAVRLDFHDAQDELIGVLLAINTGQSHRASTPMRSLIPNDFPEDRYAGVGKYAAVFDWKSVSLDAAMMPGMDPRNVQRLRLIVWIMNDAGSGGEMHIDNLSLVGVGGELPPVEQGPINPSDANALSRAVSIPNSRLISGLPPAPSASSEAPDISGNLDQLISSNGSTFLLPFQYSTNSDLSGCYIWIRGADGYFDVPYTGSSGDRGTLNIPIGLPTNVEQGSFSVSYCVYDDRGLISNILSTSINVERLGTGSLQISLAWDSGTDLDLWVTDTSGTKIYYNNRSSSTGGALDRDDIDGFGPENIYWSQAPNGTYKVEVNYYRGSGGSGTSNYTVTVSGLGTSRQFTGTLTQKGQTNFVVNILKQGNRLTFDTSE